MGSPLMEKSGKMEDFHDSDCDWRWRCKTGTTIIFCFSCIILSAMSLPLVSADLHNETTVLLDIKQAWGNPDELASWSQQFDVCSQWLYITCDAENTTITSLMLNGTSANVSSPLPASIGALVNLQGLYLDSWGLTGEIPSTIGLLRNLNYLQISHNSGLSGSIPAEIGNLTKLSSLNLQNNNFSGVLPDSIAQLRSLTYISISNGLITGALPSWIGDFPLLAQLYMENQRFTGTIPPSLGNLTSLTILDMSDSWASSAGPLPPELGKLKSLAHLSLTGDVLNSEIPESYSNLTSLAALDLNECNLVGTIPSWLGNISQLTELDLSSNSISGPIPPELAHGANLKTLRLFSNHLSQTIPTQLSQLSNLTVLDLDQNFLTGPIPTQLSLLFNLVYLDLSGNSLTGNIPPKLVTLPQLTTLNLEDNCLSGPIPAYNVTNLVNPNFGLGANNSNCFNASEGCKCAAPVPQVGIVPVAGGGSSLSKTAEDVYIAVGVVLGSLVTISAVTLLCCIRYKFLEPKAVNLSASAYKGSVRQYTVPQVREATSDFTTKVGEGAFATVYKAVFEDGTIAAVKRFNKRRPVESFEQEVEVLSSLNHRFLVNLVGYCEDSAAGEFILLYEFMDRGNLNENLHGRIDPPDLPLTWEERVRVLISVGHGIDYLHYGTDPPMIHRDIKSANILLASNGSTLIAKLADFGLGRQTVVDADVMTATFGSEPPKAFTTRVAGTPGYLDPEYTSTSVLSPKTDVYSYGVVLLELITGRRPLLAERLTLSNWAKPFLVSEDIWSILDPKLEKGTFDEEQLRSVAELALWCTENDSRKRPTIKEVLRSLTHLFSLETRMINSSQITSTAYGEFSESTDSQAHSQHKTFEISMNYTGSEVLPRD